VACAADGEEGLQHLRGPDLPDLLLLNLEMPTMNGWAFRHEQQLDPALAGIPVVIVSGVSDLPSHACQLKAVDYLPKPLDVELLLETIRRHVG
jgi:CheY-like chemotaxis protein